MSEPREPSLYGALEGAGAKIIPLHPSPALSPEEATAKVLASSANTFDALADMIAIDVRRAIAASASHEQLARSLIRTESIARQAAAELRRLET